MKILSRDFIGFIDYLLPVMTDEYGVKWFDLYDFKYSNNVAHYLESPQLHLYKYFFEQTHPGCKILDLYFLFIPKVSSKKATFETLQEYRTRLRDALKDKTVDTVRVEYEPEKVIEFLLQAKQASEAKDYPKNDSYLCRYCDFNDYCKKGWDYMILPENKRRNLEAVTRRTIWVYGPPFSGKTTFANGFPDPLMLNTDGNIKYVDAPYIRIRDEVHTEGRQVKRTLAWANFKEAVTELEKKENSFKTIVVDLLEDLYEHCRVYMYQQLGISHESDDSFKAWDMVRGEFLNTLRRLMNLDYENIILISHEDTSKDITRKGGDKITAIRPNMQEKVANKVAGMVDVVARVVADGSNRTFSFKSNEVIFGGGRLQVHDKEIPLDVNALFEVYDEANAKAVKSCADAARPLEAAPEAEKAPDPGPPEAEEPKRRGRVSGRTEPPADIVEAVTESDVEPDGEPSEVNGEPPETESVLTDEAPAETEEKPRRKRKARE